MSLCVNVLLPNGRRRNIKLSPNAIVLQTLGDICKREGYSTENYSFLFQRKILDEGLSWRYANVPNNAKLELVEHEKSKQESPVRIALQFGDGQRLQGTFKPSVTLSEILEYWKNDLPQAEHENFEPCIVYVRQEISGHSKMSTTSLKSLGLTSGSAVMRLSFKPVDDCCKSESNDDKHTTTVLKVDNKKNEAPSIAKPIPIPQNQILKTPPVPQATPISVSAKSSNGTHGIITQEMLSDALRQVSSESLQDSLSSENMDTVLTSQLKGSHRASQNAPLANNRPHTTRIDSKETPRKRQKQVTPSPEPQPDFSNFKFPEETAGMDIYSVEENEELNIKPLMDPCDREEIFFDKKEITDKINTTDVEDPGDEFFELTIEDIRRMISDLRSLQNETHDKPLLSARSREIQRLRAINQYPIISIRIIFPNRKILQGFFRPAEKVDMLYDFVAQFLASPKPRFFLYTTPPKVVLKDRNAILYDCNLSPASKVYFGLEDIDFHEDMISEKATDIMGTIADANMRFATVFELKTPEQRRRPPVGIFENQAVAPTTSSTNGDASTSGQQTSRNHPSGARPKVPKWFKMGKK